MLSSSYHCILVLFNSFCLFHKQRNHHFTYYEMEDDVLEQIIQRYCDNSLFEQALHFSNQLVSKQIQHQL